MKSYDEEKSRMGMEALSANREQSSSLSIVSGNRAGLDGTDNGMRPVTVGGNRWRILWLVALVTVCLFAAVFGLGRSYENVLTPRRSLGQLTAIYGDRWLGDGATVRLPKLLGTGNAAYISFDPWRPEGLEPAHISASLCGREVAQFAVLNSSPIKIPLRGGCEPFIIALDVLNPFSPAGQDSRPLGVKLESIHIRSFVRVPLLSMRYLGTAFLGMLLPVLALTVLLPRGRWQLLSLVVPLAGFVLLQGAPYLQYERLQVLGLLASAVLLGAVLAERAAAAARLRDPVRGSAVRLSLTAAESVALAAVLAVATGLRLKGLDFGLPENFHPDEVPKVNALMRMRGYGDLNPRYFLHPSLLLYSTYFFNQVFHWVGVPGEWRETAFLAGRTVSCLAGALSVYVTFCIGRRVAGTGVGLFAGLALAVSPLHVTSSRYLKEDALLTFFILCAVLAVVKSVQENRVRWLYVGSICAGLSMGVKYSGLLSCAIVAAAPWLRSGRLLPDWRFFRHGVCAGLLVPFVFLATTPYSVLDYPTFLKDFQSEQRHAMRGHTVSIDAWSQYWMYHVSESIIPGLTWGLSVLAFVGLGVALWQRQWGALFIVGLVILYYMPAEWVKSKPAPQPERYIYPCLPFLAIAAGMTLQALRRNRATAFAVLAGALALGMGGQRTWDLADDLQHDTRTEMGVWMVQNLPPGSRIFLDWKRYAPSVSSKQFDITYIPRAKLVGQLDIDALKKSGRHYLVLSSLFYDRYFSQPHPHVTVRERIRQVFERVPVIHEVRAESGTYAFHNPTLTVFSLKPEDFERLDRERREKRAGLRQRTSNEERSRFPWRIPN